MRLALLCVFDMCRYWVSILLSVLAIAPVSAQQISTSSQQQSSSVQVIPTNLEDIASVAAQPSVRPIRVYKSDYDNREYRVILLPNGLKTLLVSDPAAQKSAASLNVGVGSLNNPRLRPGLAHFLEHMLFLGTEKYPHPDEFQNFVSEHGGENNATTAENNTNFYFDIQHDAFDPALDRFSQFFIAPLFNADYVDRERNAVNAEYLAKINDDDERQADVLRELINPQHPASLFPVGSIDTLADFTTGSVRDELRSFFQSNYSANVMTLVLINNRSLDDLQKLAEKWFSGISNKDLKFEDVKAPLFVNGVLPATSYIRSVKDIRQLHFSFPVNNYGAHYGAKIYPYINHLLTDKGRGSLISFLKNLGWAQTLEAGQVELTRHQGLYEIRLGLTPEGYRAKDQIISTVFDYLKLAQQRGINEWRFNELKQIADLSFRFNEREAALLTAAQLSQYLHDFPAEDVLRADYYYKNFDDSLLQSALKALNKNNVLVSIVAPDIPGDRYSTYYQVPYKVVKGIAPVMELKPNFQQRLQLPDRNAYIPKNTSVKSTSMLPFGTTKNKPKLVVDNDQIKFWFLQDESFRSPKAILNLRIKLPTLNNSLENAAKANLFVAMLEDRLAEYVYPAELAGITTQLQAHARGIDLHVEGFSDKQSLLLSKIMEVLAQPEFEPERFEKVKGNLIRQLRNEDKEMPYLLLSKKVARLQLLPYWGAREYADNLQPVSFDNFRRFSDQVLRGGKVEGLYYGNIFPQDAVKLSVLIEQEILRKTSPRLPQLTKVVKSENKHGKSWIYENHLDHKDKAVALYVQALGASVEDAAYIGLINQIIHPLFFNELRTDKQLGYVVDVSPMSFKTVESSLLVVQSPHFTGAAIYDEIEQFLLHASEKLLEQFAENKNAYMMSLREQPISLSEQSEKYWDAILLNDVEFSRQQELLTAVARITPENLKKYFQLAYLNKSRQLWLTTEHIEKPQDLELITNVAEYQQSQQGYLFP